MRVVRAGEAPVYHPPLHDGVDAWRLQGKEAGQTERFWVGLSAYRPGGVAELSAAGEETVYVVLAGEIDVGVHDDNRGVDVQSLGPGDSIHLPQGTVRCVMNQTDAEARVLVIIALPIP